MSTSRLQIHEVGLRDGLQMEHETVPTATKLAWLRALAATGIDIIQVGSFVHPTRVPQMADTDAMFRELTAPGNLPAGVVLSGAMKLWIEDETYILKEGDSFRFKSTRPHRFESASKQQTRVLWAMTPPIY